jgi:putative hydrolase of the HAD superfamily
MNYGAVLIDLDGVIRHWDPDKIRELEEQYRLPSGELLRLAFAPPLLHDAVTGRITDEQWRDLVGRELVVRHGPGAGGIVAEWCRLNGGIDTEVLDLVQEVRARVPVGLLTNATTRLERDLEFHGLAGHFDHICNSARLHAAKPDPKVFMLAAEEMEMHPERCIFIDDTPGHVEAAAAAGMTALRFSDVNGLREWLSALDILP